MIKNVELQLTNDYIFKRLFSKKGNEDILKDLLESILEIAIEKVEVMQEIELERVDIKDKLGILDIRAIINENITVDIEMQMVDEKNMIERTLFYWAGLYYTGLKRGQDYKLNNKVITINILMYNIFKKENYHTIATIRDNENNEKITDRLEIHFIELPKSPIYHIFDSSNLEIVLKELDTITDFINYLKEKGIIENPTLKVLNIEGKELLSTENFGKSSNSIMTLPIELGYENKHQLLATFELPFIFRALSGILWVELIFMIGFIFCLVWQWCSIRMTVRSARIQTMGMTHLEHELKKPLAAVTSALEGIVNRKNRELTAIQEEKLKMVEVRIRKMAEITDTMLVTLKNSRLEVERASVDIVQEIGMVAEMFRILYPYARLEFQVETGEEKPLLDQVYFNYLVINLVDNAIKYGGDEPWVKVVFYRENWDWVLTVTDRGIGMPERVLKLR